MQAHLLDEQLADVLAGGADAETRAHLAACPVCRSEEEALRNALAQYREAARAAALRPEAYWQWQRAAVLDRLAARPARRLVWAGAVALVVFAASLLVQHAPPARPVVANDPSDEALLVEIEHSSRREVPRALEPAELLAQEASRSASAEPNP